MEIHEKIRFIRLFKGWSQEEMAGKLEISVNAYAKIERGETDMNLSRLKQVAEVLHTELSELFNLSDKTVIHLAGSNYMHLHLSSGEINHEFKGKSELKHELEKSQLMNKQLEQENILLKQQINDLRSMMSFLKKES